MIVLVCGFMGAGKTTLMKSLVSSYGTAGTIGYDLDEEIPKRVPAFGSTVSEMINTIGIQSFREIEIFCLEELLREQEGMRRDVIISLGGGGFHERALELIEDFPNVITVWIKIPFTQCLERIRSGSCNERPLARMSDEGLRRLYLDREKFYSMAHVHLNGVEEEISIDSLRMIASGLGLN